MIGIIATSRSAFWMGAAVILGGLMVFHPEGLSAVLPISAGFELAIGLVLLVALTGFLGWLAGWLAGWPSARDSCAYQAAPTHFRALVWR